MWEQFDVSDGDGSQITQGSEVSGSCGHGDSMCRKAFQEVWLLRGEERMLVERVYQVEKKALGET